MTRSGNPRIVIVGRPNVGKSSIFNRIVGSRKAIVESASGTTRDRIHADIAWKGKAFTIIDTGGFEAASGRDMTRLVLNQLDSAIKEADIIFFVTDVTVGITPGDSRLSEKLRKISKPIYLIVNKTDNTQRAGAVPEFFELGLGEPYAVSAANGDGIERLLDAAAGKMERSLPAGVKTPVRVAIVGRPNVGKSSYLNSVLMEERVIVHPVAGTTRDSIDTDFNYKSRDYVLIDTAGMRHNTKIKESADFFATVRAKEAVKRADVALAMIDGYDGLREDDRRVINYILDEGKAVVIAVNKWDLTKNIDMAVYGAMLIKSMNLIKNIPVIFMSAKTRRNVVSSLDVIWSAYERYKTVIAPEELKVILKSLNDSQEMRNKRMKFRYLVQEGAMPPRFKLGVGSARGPSDNLKRYIENFFRAALDFSGVPIKISYNK